jgi:hypothetical protein
MASDRFDGYLARKQTHMHKLSMVLSAAESSDGVITLDHLQKAAQLTTATEHDMIKVFESIGVAPLSRTIQEIIKYLATYKQQGLAVTQQTLARHCFQIMSQQDFDEAINACLRAGYLQLTQRDGQVYYSLQIDPQDIGKTNAS